MYGGESDESDGISRPVLEVLGKAATSVQPTQRAFDDPTPGNDLKALGLILSLDDLDLQVWQALSDGPLELRPLITAVGE